MKGEEVKSIMYTFRAISSPELFAVPFSFLPLPLKEIIWSCPNTYCKMACLIRLGPVMYSPSGQCIPCTDPTSIMYFDGTDLL